MTKNYIALGVLLLCLGFASGITVKEAIEAGVKDFYEIKENAQNTLDEVYYYKINTRTSMAVATGALHNQVLIGITMALKPLRVALNVMLNTLQPTASVNNLCRNTNYRTNADESNSNTAKLLDVPRAIAVYHTNKFLQCLNSTAQAQYQQLHRITKLELNLRVNFFANGTKPIRACGNGQTSGDLTAECIENYLNEFETAISSIRDQFGDFLIFDNTFLGIPTLYECADSISYDLDNTISNLVSSVRACGRRGGINLQNPNLDSLPKNVYIRFISEYSLNSIKALGIQTDVTKGKNTLEEYAEEARQRLPVATSPVSDPKISKALTIFSSDPTLDACLVSAQSALTSSNSASGGQSDNQCAQSYLNTLFKLQALYNATDIKLRTLVADAGINISTCIADTLFFESKVDSCAGTLDEKLTELELERDELEKSFARFNIKAIFSCPLINNTAGSTTTNSSALYNKWIQDVYKCVFG